MTTACAATLLDEAKDGFKLVCSLARSGENPETLARELGEFTADMHRHLLAAFGAGENPSSGTMLASRLRYQYEQAKASYPALSSHPQIWQRNRAFSAGSDRTGSAASHSTSSRRLSPGAMPRIAVGAGM